MKIGTLDLFLQDVQRRSTKQSLFQQQTGTLHEQWIFWPRFLLFLVNELLLQLRFPEIQFREITIFSSKLYDNLCVHRNL